MDYNYENLNPELFQEFCQALLNAEFPKIKVFPVGQPDGGRDAIQMLDNYPGNQFIVYQIKFVRKPANTVDLYKWLEGILKAESKKIDKLINKGAVAFHLITNQTGTAHFETGTIDKVGVLLKKYINIPAYCWWREDLNSKLHSKLDLKRSFPELLSATDMINIISEKSIVNYLNLLKEITINKEQEVKHFLNIDNIPYEEDKDFTGRENQLAEIVDVIKHNKTLHIKSFIFGLGGVGKTALAIQAVHEIKRQNLFPDGIIWYRVRDDELSKVISRFSTLICRAAKIKNEIIELPSLDEKVEFFKHEFKKYKLLFVLDNADNNLDTLIRPLLDILSGFSVILTSRQELTLSSSSHIINLGGLTPEESFLLFKKIIGNKYAQYGTNGEIHEICKKVGYLPLAVKLASMYIIEKRISFLNYINKWEESNERLKFLCVNSTEIEESRRNISICFELSLNELNDKQKELFLFMTLFQSNFNIAALINLLPETFFQYHNPDILNSIPDKYEYVNELLNTLKKLSFIDRLDGFGNETRIYLHPLIVEFGSEKRSLNLNEIENKVHEYYLDQLENNILFIKNDYQNIQKAIQWKFNIADHKGFIEFSKKLKYNLHKQGYWKLEKQVLELGYKASQFIDDKENIAYFIGFIGDIKIRQNDISGYLDIKKAIEICENDLTLNQIKNNENLSNNYLFFKYLFSGEPDIGYMMTLVRATEGINIASYYDFKDANISHFTGVFRNIYSHIGNFFESRRLAHISIKEEISSFVKDDSINRYNCALALTSWLNNIVNNKHYLKWLRKISNSILEIAEKNSEVDTLIVVAIPYHLRYLIYKNEFEKATILLEDYKKYFEISENENILINYFVYSSKIFELQREYIKALSYIEKANNFENHYDLKISYLAILCRDQLKANFHLKQFTLSWHLSSVIEKLIFYGISYLYATEYEIMNINKYAKLYYAYQSEINYERIILDYSAIYEKINKLYFNEDEISNLKFQLFGKINQNETSLNIKFTYGLDKKISLPKTYNIEPLSLEELVIFCKNNKLDLPIYYQLNNYKDQLSQPARFISGFLANKIARNFGNVLPEISDKEIIKKVIYNTFTSDKIENLKIPNMEDWTNLHKIILKWCNLKTDKFNIINSIIYCLNLNLEDRYRLLDKIKKYGIESFPRAIYYKLSGINSDMSFRASNTQYLRNQWRIANSLVALIGEQELPKISVCWSLDFYENKDIYNLLPLAKDLIVEPSHPEMSYSDCVVLLTKRIDDHLCNDKGLFS